ncbi:hypothetical protein GCM10011412_05000 [Maribacter cobaltidurans]|nr:hypothetical protein GCM10011412_05000 [Maribacter cobaltidurans]
MLDIVPLFEPLIIILASEIGEFEVVMTRPFKLPVWAEIVAAQIMKRNKV